MSLATGARLGPYEIEAPLGAGGMGEVYRARDTRLDRTVAIKVLPRVLAADAQFRERFEREARAISALSHPHICTLHDVGEHDGSAFLVMEYLEGETLARGHLQPDEALSFAMYAAAVTPGPTFATAPPRVLFEGQYPPPYDIAPDGRFLMVRDEPPAERSQLRFVLNWVDDVKRTLSAN
jgi:hypothetical protein